MGDALALQSGENTIALQPEAAGGCLRRRGRARYPARSAVHPVME